MALHLPFPIIGGDTRPLIGASAQKRRSGRMAKRRVIVNMNQPSEGVNKKTHYASAIGIVRGSSVGAGFRKYNNSNNSNSSSRDEE